MECVAVSTQWDRGHSAGVVDWGYLNADKVNMDPKYTDYELLGEEAEKIEGGVAPGNLGLDGGGPPAGGQKTDRGE